MTAQPGKESCSTGPVFLLAGGGRTGSTLVQRLIVSSRHVLVWWEHGGILLPQLKKLLYQTSAWIENANSRKHLADFKESVE